MRNLDTIKGVGAPKVQILSNLHQRDAPIAVKFDMEENNVFTVV